MTTPGTREAARQNAGAVCRWEWRSFARTPFLLGDGIRIGGPVVATHELYLVGGYDSGNVKVRNAFLDVKVLQSVNSAGLEQWCPVIKAEFPIDDNAVVVCCRALGIPPLPLFATPGRLWSQSRFLAVMNAGNASHVSVAHMHKQRTPLLLDDCRGEHVHLSFAGDTWYSISFEDADPERVLRAVRRIAMDPLSNISYPALLRHAAGSSPRPMETV